jgi:hypothetical protein
VTINQSPAVLIRLKAEQMRQAIANGDKKSAMEFLKDIRKVAAQLEAEIANDKG